MTHNLRPANAELIARERRELAQRDEEFARERVRERQMVAAVVLWLLTMTAISVFDLRSAG
jgi:hypothetical protein